MRIDRFVAVCTVGVLLVLPGLSLAEEAAKKDKPLEPYRQLRKEISSVSGKIGARVKELTEKDPDVKAAAEAAKLKQKELKDADAAILEKIALKDPEVKSLMDQMKAVTAKREEGAKKLNELNAKKAELDKQLAAIRAESKELQTKLRGAQKEVEPITRELRKKVGPHMKDEDLKELVAARDAKNKEVQEARRAPMAKAVEKDPELKTLVDQQKALQVKLNEMNAAKRAAKAKEKAAKEKPAKEKPTKKKPTKKKD